MPKILVADDNSNIQKMVGLALKDQGIDVVAVGNGEAAVRKIIDIHPDLVLADIFMPVRSGYEVCKFVKDDSALAHIPVILLVGAFDPLDEQEAQRVGADGVLKKPFVPPDPLISMVKSALERAKVPVNGSAASAESPAGTAASYASHGSSAKPEAPAHEEFPEMAPEPVLEDLPPAREPLHIAASDQPLAFGSLLETSTEEDTTYLPRPAEEREWRAELDDEVREEEDEESSPSAWHPGGTGDLEKAPAAKNRVPDWREEAFHGSGPSRDSSLPDWLASKIPAVPVEAISEPRPVTASAVETKLAETETPSHFTGDAWAATMAEGLQEKPAEQNAAAEPTLTEPETALPEFTADEEAQSGASPYSSETILEDHREEAAEPAQEEEPAATIPEHSWEAAAQKASLMASTWDAPMKVSPDETVEIEAAVSAELRAQEEHVAAHVEEQPVAAHEEIEEAPAAAEHMDLGAASVPEEVHEEKAPLAVQPDMDEVVSRVLNRMNPEILQKVTREILRPVIEALIRDELNPKKQ
ncbi:MAG TPA: response regulator [Candidatus Acidoferrum sp.]